MSRRILVIGAGVAGSAAARAMVTHGLDVTLVEKRSADPGPGLGLNLPGNAVRALRHLGAATRVEAAGVTIARREYRTAGDRLLFEVDEARFWEAVAPSVCVRRGVLIDALTEGLDVRRGVAVEAVQRAGGGAEVHLADGTSDHYDLVVGADGVHSVVRASVTSVEPSPSLMTAASWRFVTANDGVDCWTSWTGRGHTFLVIPVSEGEVYAYAATNRGGPVGQDPGWLATAFADFPRRVTETIHRALAATDAPYHSPVEEVRAPRWHDGRVLVLGDAAHAIGPVWAQGAALAMEDALVLARLLTDRDDWSAAVAEWERLRRPRVEGVLAATDRMSRLARLPDSLLRVAGPRLGPRGFEHAYGPLRTDPAADDLSGSARRPP